MLFTSHALEALPHLKSAARALQANYPHLRLFVALTSKGWMVALQGAGGLTVARARFSSAARADGFLSTLAAACGRFATPRPGYRRVTPPANSRGAIAVVDGSFVYVTGRTAGDGVMRK